MCILCNNSKKIQVIDKPISPDQTLLDAIAKGQETVFIDCPLCNINYQRFQSNKINEAIDEKKYSMEYGYQCIGKFGLFFNTKGCGEKFSNDFDDCPICRGKLIPISMVKEHHLKNIMKP